MKVLCIGESFYETFVTTDYFPVENSRNMFTEKIESGGGLIPNAGVLVASFGIETYIASTIGSDDRGNIIKKELENKGIKIDYIETGYSSKTSETLYLYNKTNRSCTSYNINNKVYLKKYSFGIIPDIILADASDYTATLSSFDKYKDNQTILVINNITKENMDLAKFAKMMIFSGSAASAAVNIPINYNDSNSLVNIFNKLKQKFGDANIIINISGYGVLYSMGLDVKIMPTLKNMPIIDFTGAMDAFVGGLVYGVASLFDIEKSIAYGIICDSLTSTKLSGRNAMPTSSEVINLYNSKFNISSSNVQNDNK